MKRIFSVSVTAALLLSLFSSCGVSSPVPDDNASNPKGDASTSVSSEAPKKPNQNYNPLTGEFTLKDHAVGKRPVSIMVNNIKKAWPQYGISAADISYEMVTEGGITRIMSVFSDIASVPKIGSVRSARHQFIDCSAPLNTIFVHIGGSKPGYAALSERNIDHIDGINFSSCFTQDKKLKQQKGQEFSNFTSGELIQKSIKKKKFNTEGASDPGFKFDTKGGIKGNSAASNVTVYFSGYATAYFDYDVASGKYVKSEKLGSGSSKAKQIDQNNGKQVSVTNVFVLFADVHRYDNPRFPNDKNWTDINFSKGGSGYYISGGTKTDITWTKSNYNQPFQFKKGDGTELKVNPGNSWVCITDEDEINKSAIK